MEAPCVRKEVLERALQRQCVAAAGKLLDEVPVRLRGVRVPSVWLGRLHGERHGNADAATPLSDTAPRAVARPMTVPPRRQRGSLPQPPASPLALESWLGKLSATNGPQQLVALRLHSAEAAKTRTALQRVRATQNVSSHCHAATDFLRGQRQLRDRFGSVTDGTDCTSDVVWEGILGMRHAGKELIGELCRQSRLARVHAPALEADLPSDIRRDANEALRTSERLLRCCGVEVPQSSQSASDAESESSASTVEAPSPSTRRCAEEALHNSEQLLLRCREMGMCVGSDGPQTPTLQDGMLDGSDLESPQDPMLVTSSRSVCVGSKPLPPDIRLQADEALLKSERLLRLCGALES